MSIYSSYKTCACTKICDSSCISPKCKTAHCGKCKTETGIIPVLLLHQDTPPIGNEVLQNLAEENMDKC